jgi:hypothetical protein
MTKAGASAKRALIDAGVGPGRAASRVLAALASPAAIKALDPDPFPRHSLRHAVYAALLHFGFETA